MAGGLRSRLFGRMGSKQGWTTPERSKRYVTVKELCVDKVFRLGLGSGDLLEITHSQTGEKKTVAILVANGVVDYEEI